MLSYIALKSVMLQQDLYDKTCTSYLTNHTYFHSGDYISTDATVQRGLYISDWLFKGSSSVLQFYS